MYACGLSVGDEVVYAGCSDAQVRVTDPRGKLAPGGKYIIAAIDEHDWHTHVRLAGRTDWFNSVSFVRAIPC